MNNSTTYTNDFHLVLQANSPGELSAWAIPIAQTFKRLIPNAYITLYLVPCQYATGHEYGVAQHCEWIDEVYKVSDTFRTLFGLSPFTKRAKSGAILYLGGDPFYTRWMRLRFGFKAYGYTEHRHDLGWLFEHTFYRHQDGDLMAASIQMTTFDKDAILAQYQLPDRPYILMLPGSRLPHFNAFFPMCWDASMSLIQACDADVIIGISPYVDDETLSQVIGSCSHDRIHCLKGNALEFMHLALAMLSLPGTNTAQAMYMKTPMFTACPLNDPSLLILDGLAGFCNRLPLIGQLLQRFLVYRLQKRTPFSSLPNRIANRKVVPEYIGVIKPGQLAGEMKRFIDDVSYRNSIEAALENMVIDTTVHEDICQVMIKDNSDSSYSKRS